MPATQGMKRPANKAAACSRKQLHGRPLSCSGWRTMRDAESSGLQPATPQRSGRPAINVTTSSGSGAARAAPAEPQPPQRAAALPDHPTRQQPKGTEQPPRDMDAETSPLRALAPGAAAAGWQIQRRRKLSNTLNHLIHRLQQPLPERFQVDPSQSLTGSRFCYMIPNAFHRHVINLQLRNQMCDTCNRLKGRPRCRTYWSPPAGSCSHRRCHTWSFSRHCRRCRILRWRRWQTACCCRQVDTFPFACQELCAVVYCPCKTGLLLMASCRQNVCSCQQYDMGVRWIGSCM